MDQTFGTYTVLTDQKLAVAWTTNSANLAVDGSAGTTDTSITVPVSVNILNLGARDGNNSKVTAGFYDIRFYPIRGTDAALETLTT